MGTDTCKLFLLAVHRLYNTDLFINTKMRIISPRMIAPPPAEPAMISKKERKRVFWFHHLKKPIEIPC